MPELSSLSEDDALKIISLPYKAGMLVSHADDIEGEADDEKEMRALERGVPLLAAQHESSALVQSVASEIMRMKEAWPSWEDSCFHITAQAPDVIKMVQSTFGEAEAKHYRAFTLELGKLVAQAASELEGFDDIEEEKKEGFFGGLIGKITGGYAEMGQNDAGHPANISPSEKGTLSELAAALKIS